MYLDRVKINIKAGNGGNGHTSFFRSKLTMNGGPDGGDGGKGGDVVFVANQGINSLLGFSYKKKFFATDGLAGQKQFRKGSDGKDVVIEVPCGTVIIDAETNKPIADLTEHNQKFVALSGGNGGRGNNYFKSSTRQAPKFCQTGEQTKERQVILELKTIADVGLVGYPNVGKSTLLSIISNAQPKIANYHFTTIYPNIGVVPYHDSSFIVADIPGLIEGASDGVGLGHYFLKHIERVRVIVHLVDISECEGRNAVDDYNQINTELKKYSEKLSNLPQVVAFTKTDLLSEEELNQKVENFEKQTGIKTISICSIAHKGINTLLDEVWKVLEKTPKPSPIEIEEFDFDAKDKSSLNIVKLDETTYSVEGGFIDNLIRGVVLSDEASFAYFQNALKKFGIIEKLKQNGMKDGDTVVIKDITFDYME
ncbi:MAG: GTPase ObgE [Clostridia bacterium]|nr:GTPase ObgE [Clostridia bacterium]